MRNASDYLRDENEEELKYRSSVNSNKPARSIKLDILSLVIRILIKVITLGLVM